VNISRKADSRKCQTATATPGRAGGFLRIITSRVKRATRCGYIDATPLVRGG
jgi:hypothetical protein